MNCIKIASFLFVFNVFFGFSQTKNFIDQPYLEMTVKTDTLVTPDNIYLSIFILEKDTKGKVSVEELETRMIATLEALNIDTQKKLTLKDASSSFKKYFLKTKDVLKIKEYSLLVHTGLKTGEVLLALEKIKISNVSIARTTYSKMDALKRSLKTAAVLKAKTNALALLKPLDQKLGSVLYISDQTVPVHYGAPGSGSTIYLRGASNLRHKPQNISFEKIKVESQLSIKFKINE